MEFYDFPSYEGNELFSKQSRFNFFILAGFKQTRLGLKEDFVLLPSINCEWARFGRLACEIPYGYKALILMERHAIVRSGHIIWKNKATTEPLGSETCYVGKYFLFDPDGNEAVNRAPRDHIKTWEEALTLAKDLSIETGKEFLISRAMLYENWH